MPDPVPVIHCINQFFGGLGGEESADLSPQLVTGARGPGVLLEKLAPGFEVVATVIFGDNDAAERRDAAVEEMLDLIEKAVAGNSIPKPKLLLAGPAFNAGRYGMTCGAICEATKPKLGIPAVTGMFDENPGVDLFRRKTVIVRTESNVLGMQEAMSRIATVAEKLITGKTPDPGVDQTIPRGIRVNRWDDQSGAQRALDMLVKKCRGEPFRSEYELPKFERVTPAPPVADTAESRLALVTSGGIVPCGNPDHIEAASASRFGEYDIRGLDALSPKSHETAHGGYDPTYANADPNRVLPLDAARILEREGRIGKLHDSYFATVGNATSVERAEGFGREIARQLLEQKVQAVILTSTWGTCTRCGATLVKELERAGIPTVHVCSIVPISLTVGANRIVPSIAIPHPLGDPTLTRDEERVLRRNLVEEALTALETTVEEPTVFGGIGEGIE